ncbi:glycosyltransferase [Sediminibacterium sp.]|jgi:cellulose synthase/poly-beta-1,6-N-acetylglucosamine synthase-like glycosyltransferase|uniref:glycosyltransferase n=1 Tax=Sediminibacterium sp. TaxID=1917865 RepID=UPI00273330F4|nr:glycosyltransferase [Sediminibacterium sp.]MDP3392877.1 glycosyltransferase [Sediminibacterium sp.]MDP3565999.1 glycosyltransferase [Sediminibacterium sp.]
MNFQDIINLIWYVFQIAIGYNLILPFFLLLLYAIVKLNKEKELISTNEADYAIIVTAYEQTTLIPSVVASLLKLNYSNYLIYIVADKCDITNLKFDDNRVIVLRPEQTLSSNTRSHFYAINRFKREHERLTIIDSDNLVDPNYLIELNKLFDQGFSAVQGVRDAKNLDTLYAALDGARDIYYHFYDGKVLFNVGSSATLAGSGMAFTTQLYKDCLAHLDITGAGFDKILQKEIVSRGYRIAFATNAIVYDEKTSKSDQLVNQRARWINTWFKYFSFGFGLIGKGILKLDWNMFLFGLILLRPPLFIFLLIGLFCMLLNLIFNPFIAMIWLLGFVIFVLGFILALAINNTDARIYKSLWGIPKFIFYQVLSLLKVRNANKHSVATKHFHTDKNTK